METSKISWTDGTANAWEGCEKVSAGCLNCYAENRDQRYHGGQHWGKGAPRKKSKSFLNNLARYDRMSREGKFIRCGACGRRRWAKELCSEEEDAHGCKNRSGSIIRPIFFVMSLGDFFDAAVDHEWRAEALKAMMDAQAVDMMVLSKRPELMRPLLLECAARLPDRYRQQILAWMAGDLEAAPRNMAFGTSVESPLVAGERIFHLINFPCHRRFISAEPLLGRWAPNLIGLGGKIDLVITGGESGTKARPCHPEWVIDLEQVCDANRIPFHHKQWGEWAPADIVEPDWTKPVTGNMLAIDISGKILEGPNPVELAKRHTGAALFWRAGAKASGRRMPGKTERQRTEILSFPLAAIRDEWWKVAGTTYGTGRLFPSSLFAQEFIRANPSMSATATPWTGHPPRMLATP